MSELSAVFAIFRLICRECCKRCGFSNEITLPIKYRFSSVKLPQILNFGNIFYVCNGKNINGRKVESENVAYDKFKNMLNINSNCIYLRNRLLQNKQMVLLQGRRANNPDTYFDTLMKYYAHYVLQIKHRKWNTCLELQ